MMATSLELIASHPILGCGPGNYVADTLGGRDNQRGATTRRARGEPRLFGKIDGLESYNMTVKGKRSVVPLQVHNKYLLVLVELGIVGLLLLAWFQWRLWQTAWDCLRTSDPMLFWVAAALLGATLATHVYFMLELAYDDKSVLILMVANALVLCLHRIVKAESASALPQEATL
jgi:O-antigen ligase